MYQINASFSSGDGGGSRYIGVENRVKAIVGIEGSLLDGDMVGVIVSEFCERKERGPVVLMVGEKAAQVLFQGGVGAFCLTIALRMVGGSERWLTAKQVPKTFPEFGDEGGATVGQE